MTITEDAQKYAIMMHGQQARRGILVIDHVREVVNVLHRVGVSEPAIIGAGWLHDVIEHTDADMEDITSRFGPDVSAWVEALSKSRHLPSKQREAQYVRQLHESPWQAQVIKLADIAVNLQHILDSDSPPSLIRDKVAQLRSYMEAIRPGLTVGWVPGLPRICAQVNQQLASRGQGLPYWTE